MRKLACGGGIYCDPLQQKDPRYYAYNRLSVIKHVPAVNAAEVEEFLETTDRVRVSKERFTVRLDPAYVKKLMKAQAEKIDGLFELPGDWETTRYTYGTFKKAFAALYAMCAARFRAHVIAIGKGVLHNGYRDGVLLAPRQDLTTLVTRYAQASSSEVTAILEDLTYKGRGIKNPDPALQPIVELHGDCLAIAPSVVLSVSPERNLCVLMNRIPDEKKQYASLVDEKEELQRKEFLASPGCARYRSWAGSVPGRPDLPDVDLALVDDESKTVLICELKWLIGPDEVREVLDKNKELEKGIREARALEDAFNTGCSGLHERLATSSAYRCQPVVVSQNWIGQERIQSADVPIVISRHLRARIARATSLTDVAEWLRERKYLPIAGEHFSVVQRHTVVGDYSTTWQDVEPLIQGVYEPGG